MNLAFRTLLAGTLAIAPLVVQAQTTDVGSAENNAALALVGRIPVPNMTGTWDHLTVDLATDRLFASAQFKGFSLAAMIGVPGEDTQRHCRSVVAPIVIRAIVFFTVCRVPTESSSRTT